MLIRTLLRIGDQTRRCKPLAVLLGFCCFLCLAGQMQAQPFAESKLKNWHQWRGPDANGVSRTATPPIEWGEGKNIRWKVALDGKGSSTPIIWDNKVFLLTAIDTGIVDPSLPKPEDQPERVFGIKYPNTLYEFVVLCFDRDNGKEIWRRTATRCIPHEGHHGDNNFASASPTTDGERLYCWFGSVGLFCYDLDGRKLWDRDLGKAFMGASLGEGCFISISPTRPFCRAWIPRRVTRSWIALGCPAYPGFTHLPSVPTNGSTLRGETERRLCCGDQEI